MQIDIAIMGGGIAGLWLANVLQKKGYDCVVLERDQLGGRQTLLSQGIIHGGLKYALSGALSGESEAISGMPNRWRQCLEGNGEVDLSGVEILSDTQHLWSAGSMASRVTTFFASRMLRGRIDKLKAADHPSALADKMFRGQVYQLDDLVLDTPSLVRKLISNIDHRALQFNPEHDSITWDENGVAAIQLDGLTLEPKLTILAAGSGNTELLAQAHQHNLALDVHSQERPLHMALVRHRLGHKLYAHCVGASNKPRLTVTTHPLDDGSLVWYLGGDIAENGVDASPAELIEQTKQELEELLPWLDFSDAEFGTVHINRAEPKQDSLIKPDNAYAQLRQNLIISWPTKLTLAPDLGERVLELVSSSGIEPSQQQATLPEQAIRPAIANARWSELVEQRQ